MEKGEHDMFNDKRGNDVKMELAMQPILDAEYKKAGIKIVRVDNAELQKKGIDFETDSLGSEMRVDEKAATSREDAYEGLPTYSFEITTNNNKNGEGWLFHSDSMTTHYMLIFPQTSDGFETIEAAELMLVAKDDVLELLADAGIFSRKDAEELMKYNGVVANNGRKYCRINDAVKLVHSLQLKEQPLNAVIDRGVLRRMAVKVIRFDKRKVAA